jgi:hypothetical protein
MKSTFDFWLLKHTAATLLTGAAPKMPPNSLVTKMLVVFWLTAVPILKAASPSMAGKRLTLSNV